MGSYRGESGDPQQENPNAAVCRRWSEACPQVFADRVLGNPVYGITVSFDTFACSGARTEHVHEPTDPEGLSVLERHNETNRPSLHTFIRDIELDSHGEVAKLTIPDHWEPRQAISLKRANTARPVDMVTITIGGNDADFSDVLSACVFVVPGFSYDFTCNEEDIHTNWETTSERVEEVIARLKHVAPDAVIFVIGYPYVTPWPSPCPAGQGNCQELGLNSYIDGCSALSARRILVSTRTLFGLTSPGVTKIDHVEADFLRRSADALNTAIENATTRAGAHFVGVATPSIGHSACGPEPWIHGFVLDYESGRFVHSSLRSFHPTAAGQSAISRLIEEYIKDRSLNEAMLTDAGLPVNPVTNP